MPNELNKIIYDGSINIKKKDFSLPYKILDSSNIVRIEIRQTLLDVIEINWIEKDGTIYRKEVLLT